jgi:uncharacterized protein YggU (UPF0235/DUF167 family)
MFIKLKVHPGARRDKLVKKSPDAYEIWTKSPPERGLANASAIRQLSLALGIHSKTIMLIKGATSPAKIVKIITPELKK